MSVEAMVRLIAAEAETEAAAIVAAAQDEAAGIVAAAQASADARVAAARALAEPGIRGEGTRLVNAARLRLLERRAERAAERSAAVFAAATERLARIADGAEVARWERALRRLAGEALELAGGGGEIQLRARDTGAVAGVADGAGARVVPLPDDAPAGLVIRSADGRIEVDARLRARLARARLLLADRVAADLGLEATGGDPEPEGGVGGRTR
jgi:vacuolar-type H+-ATPase subunit E/Vma4